MEKLGQDEMDDTQRQVVCITQDSFYKELSAEDSLKAKKGKYNFDHPDALDFDLLLDTLQAILCGKKCQVPVYDYSTNSRLVLGMFLCEVLRYIRPNRCTVY